MDNKFTSPSTASLVSTDTSTSSTPLRKPQNPPKDYMAALGVLQSRYGTSMSLPPPSKKTLKESTKQLPTSAPQSAATSISTLSGSESSSSQTGPKSTPSEKPKKNLLRSLFKGKGKDKQGGA